MHFKKIKEDLKKAMLAKNEVAKNDIRYVMSELSRNYKEPTDEEVESTLKKIKKMEAESMASRNETSSTLMDYVESLLPKQVSKEEISSWIKENVDFSKFKNKMQACGEVVKHFGNAVDGKVVSQIINTEF